MIVTTEKGEKIDLNKGIDLSIPLSNDADNPLAWYVKPPRFEPVMEDEWIGEVKQGGAVNFRNIFFNPHGHGTHTECLGHITPEIYSINKHLNQYFFKAVVISVSPVHKGEDAVVTLAQLEKLKEYDSVEAVILRTLPNTPDKKSKNYSSTNPPYLDVDCLELFNQKKIKHLLLDLPSVDKESDGGELAFHHGFWQVPENPRFDRTITEMIFVPNEVEDGTYLLNLQVAPFENDASPSRPVIFRLF
ncbi:cyclase family protein [Brumimicrobium aurantiacum]|uniref:Cyclase family protein n=1 Tax=Brumimicrobium aurantiacum TaxID=1737063 RepID=A0A3E1EVM5_9FLAO|nr:cyclase family protein [Brumimicrobium aurantiacum]RFC53578.1 cyclase family protein [Brumimicrobium aurantiacum]